LTTLLDSPTNNIDAKVRKKRKIKRYCVVSIILLFLVWLIYATEVERHNGKMIRCCANIFQLSFAIRSYQEFHDGKYPQYQSDNGEHLWSWRFVVKDPTWQCPDQKFHKDEPWNSEYNLQSIELSNMDELFICPCRRSKDKRATYVAVTGPGTAWTEISKGNVKNPKKTCRNMILFIETSEPKNHWAEPGDDISPEEVIRLFQADPGLVKNSKPWFKIKGKYFSTPVYFCHEGHWPKFFATVGGGYKLFSEIKSVEELRKRLYVPEEYLINKPEQ